MHNALIITNAPSHRWPKVTRVSLFQITFHQLCQYNPKSIVCYSLKMICKYKNDFSLSWLDLNPATVMDTISPMPSSMPLMASKMIVNHVTSSLRSSHVSMFLNVHPMKWYVVKTSVNRTDMRILLWQKAQNDFWILPN